MVNPSAIAVTVADAAPGTLPKKMEEKKKKDVSEN